MAVVMNWNLLLLRIHILSILVPIFCDIWGTRAMSWLCSFTTKPFTRGYRLLTLIDPRWWPNKCRPPEGILSTVPNVLILLASEHSYVYTAFCTSSSTWNGRRTWECSPFCLANSLNGRMKYDRVCFDSLFVVRYLNDIVQEQLKFERIASCLIAWI